MTPPARRERASTTSERPAVAPPPLEASIGTSLPWTTPAWQGTAGRGSVRTAAPPTPTALDNLTHALVGAAISKAGAERATPLATATLVVAANIPDVDIAAFVGGPYFALAVRRGITHGLPAMVVWPFVCVGAMLAWDRCVRRRRDAGAEPARAGPLLVLAALGVLTHPALDWMNTYGMRWWLPFSGAWTYGDALFIIDPWIWLWLGGAVFLASKPDRWGMAGWGLLAVATTALLAYGAGPGALLPWSAGLVVVVAVRLRHRASGAWGGARVAPDARRERIASTAPPPLGPTAVARVGGVVLVYVVLMVAAGAAARGRVRSAAEGAGLTVEDVMVAPVPGNPFRAEVEVRTPDAFVPGMHRWIGGPPVELDAGAAVPRLAAPARLAGPTVDAILAAARARPEVRDYLLWSRYPHVRVDAEGSGWSVRFGDARYDDRPEAGGLSGVTAHIHAAEIR